MKAVRDLAGLGRTLAGRLGVEAASIAAHDFDLGMPLEPMLCTRHRADRQDVSDGSALEIDDDRAIGLTLPPTPIIDAYDPKGNRSFVANLLLFEPPQDGIAAGGHCEPPQQPFTDPFPGGMTEKANDLGKARGASSEWNGEGG